MTKKSLPIITEIETIEKLNELLANNPGLIIIKFSASWCGPCKRIEKLVHDCMDYLPDTVQGIVLDVDENFEVYGYFQKKRLLKGIPAILAFNKGATVNAPSDCVLGANNDEIVAFFERCKKHM